MDSKIMEQDEQKNNSFQPQLMINLLNGVLSKVKNELHQQGVDVHLDATGRPVSWFLLVFLFLES
ncbi:unnamed protein product [Anisakis simplex]|uniref:Type IV pili twitching motility protein PilT n=1 Tax=Anisakis simplex TaxID=6269 RepID=A0A0M3KK24_ANISI|nr:unnamed protein product [Anisakis simplex]